VRDNRGWCVIWVAIRGLLGLAVVCAVQAWLSAHVYLSIRLSVCGTWAWPAPRPASTGHRLRTPHLIQIDR